MVKLKGRVVHWSKVRSGDVSYLIQEYGAEYDSWLRLMVGGLIGLTLILGIVFITIDLLGAVMMFGVTVFDALLFYAIIPRRYQIFQDRLRIVLGRPFAINIPLSTITEARAAPASEAFVYWGVRFATSAKSVVEIVRHKGLNLVISPANRESFLEQLHQALEDYRQATSQ